jgi:regulatory protein YycH of two-component signal transduction system YycFG
MKITRDMVKAAVKQSMIFPSEHFGLRVGENWPEFVTEVLKSETVQAALLSDFTLAQMVAMQMVTKTDGKVQPLDVAKNQQFAEAFLRWLYIGVEIGKQVAEAEKLEAMFGGDQAAQ